MLELETREGAVILAVRLHAFLALVLTSMAMGLAAGMPPDKVLKSIQAGFGEALGFIALVIGSDEYFNFGTIVVTDPINITTRYWVRATNACGPTDSNTAILTIPQCATTIITDPKDTTVTIGTPVSLSVLVSASGALTYQWYRAQSGDPSNPVAGGTGPVLTFTPTSTGITQYWVKVSNGCSSANSKTVTVTVNCGSRTLTMSVPPTAPSAWRLTI